MGKRNDGTGKWSPDEPSRGFVALYVAKASMEDKEELGIREWMSNTFKPGKEDKCKTDSYRYVLQGTGRAICPETNENFGVSPNTLVRTKMDCTLKWQPDDEEIVVLTPEYIGFPLLIVFPTLLALVVALIAAANELAR